MIGLVANISFIIISYISGYGRGNHFLIFPMIQIGSDQPNKRMNRYKRARCVHCTSNEIRKDVVCSGWKKSFVWVSAGTNCTLQLKSNLAHVIVIIFSFRVINLSKTSTPYFHTYPCLGRLFNNQTCIVSQCLFRVNYFIM